MRYGVVVSWLLLGLATDGETQNKPYFTEITDEVELDFVHNPGEDSTYFMPESMGSGGAFLDYDSDGDLDIYLIQAGSHSSTTKIQEPNHLFRQEEDGTFTDMTQASGLGDTGYGMGLAVADFDNDGDVDIYVTNYGPDTLYRNGGQGKFTDVTSKAGIAGDAWSASAVFCDYNRDGFLDLYVSHYLLYNPKRDCEKDDGTQDYCAPEVFPGTVDTLYRNDGDGTFTDVTDQAGLRTIAAPGLGVTCFDHNEDGYIDFYVANDGQANQLWENQGNGTLVDRAFVYGVALNGFGQAEAGMGLTVGDVDSDGDFDLFITHLMAETNTLYLNERVAFRDATGPAGLAASSLARTGFGAAFFDFDHDSDLDIVVVNGRVMRQPTVLGAAVNEYWNPYAEPNLLYANDGEGRFKNVSSLAGTFSSQIEVSRGLALGDVDDDGDLDILVTNTAGQARLFRNDAIKAGSWLTIRTFDPTLKRDAYGSVVTLVAGGKTYQRIVDPGSSYLSSNDTRAHFGISGKTNIQSIMVRWPDGYKESFPSVAVNQAVILEKGAGKATRE